MTRLWLVVLGTLLCFSHRIPAQEHEPYRFEQGTRAERTYRSYDQRKPRIDRESYAMAEIWGLTEEEWTRYLSLKRSFRGYWSPDLDPLTTLGVHAETEQQRKHYAQLFVKLEKQRIEGETAFDRAVREARGELFPDLPMINRDKVQEILRQRKKERSMFVAGDRALVFVKTAKCARCGAIAASLIERTKAIPNFAVDFYFVGTAVTDEGIREWATKQIIPPALVEEGVITLNHDRGTLARLLRDPFPTVPQVIRARPAGEEKAYEVLPVDRIAEF